MQPLFKLISKNFKLLLRSKSSALIIILGPLLVIFLVGIAFDNLNKYSLNIGTYSSSYSELSESFISKLKDQQFTVKKIDSEELCVEQIKLGKLHTCIIFPPDLALDSEKVNEIVFHVDYSKINLIWMVLDTISTKLKERSSELSVDLTSELLSKMESARMEIYNRRPDIINLKTENQQVSTTIDDFQSQLDTMSDMKTYLLERVTGAETVVSEVKSTVNESNASQSQKDAINMKASEIGTYLLNIKNKLQERENATTDLSTMTSLLADMQSQISSLKTALSKSSSTLNIAKDSLDKIYDDIESIQIKNATTIVKPITTNIKPVVPEKTHLGYLFPSLIVLVIMFISILLATTIVQMEKHSPAYFRNFITPTKDITFIASTYLTNLVLVTLQIIIIMGISIFFFKAQIIPSLIVSLPLLLLITTLFTFIGMLIGYLFISEETATLASISIGSVFLFLSSLILPLESMPESVRQMAQFNPFVISEGLLKKAILFKADFIALSNDIILVIAYSATLFLIIWISQDIVRKHLFHRLHLSKLQKQQKNKPRFSFFKRNK